jgi:hypothetical protein
VTRCGGKGRKVKFCFGSSIHEGTVGASDRVGLGKLADVSVGAKDGTDIGSAAGIEDGGKEGGIV